MDILGDHLGLVQKERCQVVHTMWCVQEVDCLMCQVVHTMWCVQEADCLVCCQCTCDVYRKLLPCVLSGGAHQVVCTGSWLHGVLSGGAHHVMCTGSWLPDVSGGAHHVMCTGSWLSGVLSGGAHHVMCTGSWLPGVLSGGAHHVMCTGSWLPGVLSVYLWCLQEVAARCVVRWCTPSGVYRKLIAWCVVRWCTPSGVYGKLIAWCVVSVLVICTGSRLHGVLSVCLWCVQEVDCMVCCQVVHTM